MDLQSALSALASDFTTRALHSPRHKGLLVGLNSQVSALVTQAQALEADNNDTVLVAQLRHVSEFLQDLNTFTVLHNSRNLFFAYILYEKDKRKFKAYQRKAARLLTSFSVEITRIALKNGHIPSQSSVRSVSSTTRSSNAAPHFPATGAVSSERQSSLSPCLLELPQTPESPSGQDGLHLDFRILRLVGLGETRSSIPIISPFQEGFTFTMAMVNDVQVS
ncbi:hypothetical protein D9758_014786 [Tetrapyrgos nigripes]|uniref:Uncharacterized protein n=1 Tax=Tetrapyrgos nigripes TaxID=182062 RepID=A0A8H5C7W3_9AGAR|nr:hypothetical protein D9758_014786 [Tetrapyrgos nigripes]